MNIYRYLSDTLLENDDVQKGDLIMLLSCHIDYECVSGIRIEILTKNFNTYSICSSFLSYDNVIDTDIEIFDKHIRYAKLNHICNNDEKNI